MKILSDVPERTRHWYELFSRSADTPYRTILVTAERVADELERRMTEGVYEHVLASYNKVFADIEKTFNLNLSIGDVGEVLVILGNFWEHGDALLDEITHIERKIVTENVTYRLKQMAEDAQKADAP